MNAPSGLVDELRATLGKLELALGAIEDAIVWTSAEGRVQWCNSRFDALVGRAHLAVLGAELAGLLPLEPPLGKTGLYRFGHGAGARALEVHSSPVRLGEADASVVLVIRDVTERQRAEEALRASRDKAEAAYRELEIFSYSISHDLRGPLRKIDGYSQAVLEDYGDRLDDAGRGFLQRMRAASQRMAGMIDAILDLARMARSPVVLEDFDLGAMAEGIAAELREAEPERAGEFLIQAGLVVRADPRLMRVCLENLLRNAWKFTSKHPRARIELGAREEDGGRVYFVRDDGAGFDPAYASKLFGPFSRLHRASEFPGTGVGLVTCQRIILRHGGRLWAEAAPERGATFFFTLGPGGGSGG